MERAPFTQVPAQDPRRREMVARGQGGAGGVRRKMYYLSRGCGAEKEATAFLLRNGRGGGGEKEEEENAPGEEEVARVY